ncbi:MAG: arginine--tRNA ligase [Planctomycetes bacterium]|nr:arginine--tRNA ligase [Planctomycetota bacterium]
MDTLKHHHVFRTLVARLAAATHLPPEQVEAQLRPPPKADMGDYAFPCFELAKAEKKAPPEVAKALAERLIRDPEISQVTRRIEAAGPFLNIQAEPGVLCAAILHQIVEAKEKFGHGTEGAGRTIVIDYSAPNFAKPFHVGHLMSTILGASLVRIFRALGYRVEGVNHLGDWGTQCGFQFLAWRRADPKEREEQLAKRGLEYLVELYVSINAPGKALNDLRRLLTDKEIAADPSRLKEVEAKIEKLKPEVDAIDNEARALFKKLEDGDAELKALWQRMRDTTLQVLQKSYDRLGIVFESDSGEAFYTPMLPKLIEDLKKRGILVQDEGCWVIPMSEPGAKKKALPVIVVKSDGTTKYETRDLAAAIYRKEHYEFAQNIYVVDMRQKQHFDNLFKALEKCGYGWAKDCHHVWFGLMQGKDGDQVQVMATRGGSMIPLKDLLDRMVGIVRMIVREKNPELKPEQQEIVAEAVGVGAIVFWVQSRRRTSDIVFDWKLATSPDGDTGPYVQYTHARACSILRKHEGEVSPFADLKVLEAPAEVAVCKHLDRFGEVIRQAAKDYEPSLIASWLIETARAFNDFYNQHQVLKADTGAQRDARLVLVDATRRVLAEGLRLIGVSAPQEM